MKVSVIRLMAVRVLVSLLRESGLISSDISDAMLKDVQHMIKSEMKSESNTGDSQ